ncbi:hypothetical protein SFUMM280S_08576 [Streptomyces fumanus]
MALFMRAELARPGLQIMSNEQFNQAFNDRSGTGRAAVHCTLLVMVLGAACAGCGGDDDPLAARPYDAAGQISFDGPCGRRKKADPDKPLEVVARGADGRITDVTAVDRAGRYLAGELSADGTRWHSTAPLAADASYTVRVSTESPDGAPGRKVLTFDTGRPATKQRLDVAFGPKAGTYGVGQPITAELSQPVRNRPSGRWWNAP